MLILVSMTTILTAMAYTHHTQNEQQPNNLPSKNNFLYECLFYKHAFCKTRILAIHQNKIK